MNRNSNEYVNQQYEDTEHYFEWQKISVSCHAICKNGDKCVN